MDASLMEQRRVSEEGFRVVKLCCWRRMVGRVTVVGVTVSNQKATANYVPTAAVIRPRWQALSGFMGVKRAQAVFKSDVKALGLTEEAHRKLGNLSAEEGRWNSMCSGEMRRYMEEHQWRRRLSGL